MDRGRAFCMFEDRPSHEPGVRLAVLSLRAFHPNTPILYFADPGSGGFADWLTTVREVRVVARPDRTPAGWNAKPSVLLAALDMAFQEVVWIDPDILLTRSLAPLLDGLRDDTLVEEALWGCYDDGEAARTRALGLPVGRSFPFALNSCIVRATARHRALLDAWQRHLQSESYRHAQTIDFHSRPVCYYGDQDVLTGLLGSSEFSGVPLRILRRGKDILQLFGTSGFTVAERLAVLTRGLPTILHQQGRKVWELDQVNLWVGLLIETSPYLHAAERYRGELGSTGALLRARSPLARSLNQLARVSPALPGLALQAAVAAGKFGRALGRRARPGRRPPP